jgi:hypothetical protein
VTNNQLGRRNLGDYNRKIAIGKRYLTEKRQGERTDLTCRQNDDKLKTAHKLASEYKVAPRTIERDASFAVAVDTAAKLAGDDVRKAVLSRDAVVVKKDPIAM